MIQAGVSNLPTDLEGAARTLGCGGKQADGKKLIRLFSIAGAAPADHPEEWRRFLDYAERDVEAMREVYRRTRPLPLAEWRQYWAFERINRRGVHVDTPFVERAAALAAEDAAAIGRRLAELTDGAVTTVEPGQTDRGLAARPAARRGDARGADHRRPRRRGRGRRSGRAGIQLNPRPGGARARPARGETGQRRSLPRRDESLRGRDAPPLWRRGVAEEIRPHRARADRRRHSRSVSFRRRRPDRPHVRQEESRSRT